MGGSCDVILNIEKVGGKVFQRIYPVASVRQKRGASDTSGLDGNFSIDGRDIERWYRWTTIRVDWSKLNIANHSGEDEGKR